MRGILISEQKKVSPYSNCDLENIVLICHRIRKFVLINIDSLIYTSFLFMESNNKKKPIVYKDESFLENINLVTGSKINFERTLSVTTLPNPDLNLNQDSMRRRKIEQGKEVPLYPKRVKQDGQVVHLRKSR